MNGRDGAGRAIGRRGLVAGAAALVAGMATFKQSEVARAGSDGDITVGGDTPANTTTTLTGRTFFPLAGGTNPFSGNPIFRADASQTNLQTTVQQNVDGIHGVGIGTYSGVVGYGGDNGGNGVYGFGVGTGVGVAGLGGNLFGAAGVLGLGNGVSANNGVGVRGNGANSGVGVEGRGGGTNATGVLGFGGGTAGQGMAGIGAATGPGVVGVGGNFGATNNADGVQGFAAGTGSGVVGRGGGSNGIGLVGVGGESSGAGVSGSSNAGYGVYGRSTNGAGVYGLSTASYGGIFITTSGAYAVLAGASGSRVAFGGSNTDPTGYAAYFTGNVKITGGKLFLDGQTLQSLSAHSDGSKRVTYGVQGAEPLVEDVGEGQLVGGKADIALDPAFAGLISGEQYRIFLTPRFDSKGLYIAAQTAAGFSVREQQGGTSGGGFYWRVVATPKNASKAQRLARHTLPEFTVPTVDDLPKPPPVTPPVLPTPPIAPKDVAPNPVPPSRTTPVPPVPPPSATVQPASAPTAAPTVMPPNAAPQAPNPAPPPRT